MSGEAVRRAVSSLRRALHTDGPQDIIQTVHAHWLMVLFRLTGIFVLAPVLG